MKLLYEPCIDGEMCQNLSLAYKNDNINNFLRILIDFLLDLQENGYSFPDKFYLAYPIYISNGKRNPLMFEDRTHHLDGSTASCIKLTGQDSPSLAKWFYKYQGVYSFKGKLFTLGYTKDGENYSAPYIQFVSKVNLDKID